MKQKQISYSVRDLIDLWPSRKALADDVGATHMAVHHWHGRQSISAKYHYAMALAAVKRGINISLGDISDAHTFQVGNSKSDIQGQQTVSVESGAA